MKRFATLLTVSITMAAVALAGHPVVEPDTGGDVGFPFHPGQYMAATLDAGCVWTECFCTSDATHSGSEWPSTGDPSVIGAYDVLRMNRTAGSGFNAKTYVQSPASYDWTGRTLDVTFYFAVQEAADALGFYLTPASMDAATFATLTPIAAAGLSFIIDRTPAGATLDVYEDGAFVTSGALPIYDQNFHLIRIRYDDFTNAVKVTLFEMLAEEVIVPWTAVGGLTGGWIGFGGFVPAATGAYQYIDDICACVIDDNGDEVTADELPMDFTLGQNYPNPFNPTTTISFTMPETGVASLKVFDLAGREVASLVNGLTSRGNHNVVFDASGLTSGVYFYTFEGAGVTDTRKMVLVK
ncbi:MAG: T9SS type A sorting domain-containing protein [bacterium]|nr:T9SS type A sorting domain-containing protein [bacterium]